VSNVCPGCNKFAALSEPEMEDENPDPSCNGDGSGSVAVRIFRTSECCGEEMKEANFDLEFDLSDDYRQHWEDDHDGADHMKEPEFDLTLETTNRQQTTMVKKGKKRKDGSRGPSKTVPIRNYRYMPSFFGVQGTLTVKCGDCGAEIGVVELSDEVPASGMDELN
jgi:hypothetical protein